MDYENIKAIIESRMKKYQEEGAVIHKDVLRDANSTFDLASSQIAVRTCEVILQDLETFHSILQGQE
jgi:hypothetical protein